jgi:succinoglycan biosynthesis transport protein ExoP
MEDDQERSGIGLLGYWQRICHYRWQLVICTFAGWMLATTVSWLLPPKYRSDTVILVEQQRIPAHYVEPNVAADYQQRLQNMSEQILSRTRLLAIVDKFRLYSADRKDGNSDALIARMRKNIDIELVRTRRDELSAFKISYSHSNPALAQQVAGELTSLFINENVRNRAQLSEDTTAFLENQLTESRRSLDEQEQRLREYRSRYLGQLPEQLPGNVQILTGLQTQLSAETDALQRLEQQRLLLQYQHQAVGGDSVKSRGPAPAVAVPDLDQKLETLKAELNELSTRYTAQHPDMLKVQNEIARTEARRAKVVDELKDPKGSGNSQKEEVGLFSDGRGLSQITPGGAQLRTNDLELANQKKKIQRLESQIDQYRERLNQTPVREQQLAGITRDYEQSRTYYDSLLAKKLQSEMATNLEKRQQGEQFRMIDPPNLPQKPYWPNRLLFSMGGLVAGTMVGLGILMLVEMKNPKIYCQEELRDIEGVHVMVSIPTLLTEGEKRSAVRRLFLEGAAATVILAVISAGTLLTYYKG